MVDTRFKRGINGSFISTSDPLQLAADVSTTTYFFKDPGLLAVTGIPSQRSPAALHLVPALGIFHVNEAAPALVAVSLCS